MLGLVDHVIRVQCCVMPSCQCLHAYCQAAEFYGSPCPFLQEVLGMYCHFILADYITLAAAPLGAAGQSSDMSTFTEHHAVHILPAAAAALKPGACALYGACSPAQVRCQERLTCLGKPFWTATRIANSQMTTSQNLSTSQKVMSSLCCSPSQ